MDTNVSPLPVILSGVLAGLMSGLLGVGGGIVMVPLLVYAARLDQHHAHATSLAAVIGIGIVGAITFGFAGEVDVPVALLLALGSFVGAPLGARAMHRIAENPLKIAFGCLMIVVAGILLWT